MPGRLDDAAILSKLSPISHPNARYLAEADESVILSIKNGVLLLLAFWSGSAILSYRRLLETLQDSRAQQLDVVVVNHDGAQPLYQLPVFIGRLGGYGETAWIRNGRIVATTFGKSGPDQYAERLNELLNST